MVAENEGRPGERSAVSSSEIFHLLQIGGREHVYQASKLLSKLVDVCLVKAEFLSVGNHFLEVVF